MPPTNAANATDTAANAARAEREYVLGTDENELFRLGLQHRLWNAATTALWERAGFGPGQTILDVGCGPGHAAFDLAQLAGPTGRIVAVDVSQRFIEHLQQQCRVRGVANIEAHVGDVQALCGNANGSPDVPPPTGVSPLDLPSSTFDRAYARWVLCFVPRPQDVIAGVARALRPGGRFAIQDYTYYRGVRLSPPCAEFERVFAATDASWRAGGGDPEIGMGLPAMLEEHGLRVDEIRPLTRAARPGDPLWQWPTTFFRYFIPRLIEGGYLTQADHDAFNRAWAERTADPNSLFISPPMAEFIATRRTVG